MLSCSDRSQYTYRSQSVPRSLSAAPGRRDVVYPQLVVVSRVMSASLSPLSMSNGVLHVVQNRPDYWLHYRSGIHRLFGYSYVVQCESLLNHMGRCALRG